MKGFFATASKSISSNRGFALSIVVAAGIALASCGNKPETAETQEPPKRTDGDTAHALPSVASQPERKNRGFDAIPSLNLISFTGEIFTGRESWYTNDHIFKGKAFPKAEHLVYERNFVHVYDTLELASQCIGLLYFPEKIGYIKPVRAEFISIRELDLVAGKAFYPYEVDLSVDGKRFSVPSYQTAFIVARYGDVDVAIRRDYHWEIGESETYQTKFLDVCGTDELFLARGGASLELWSISLTTGNFVHRWGSVQLATGPDLLGIEIAYSPLWNLHEPIGIEAMSAYDVVFEPEYGPLLVDYRAMRFVPSPFIFSLPLDSECVFSSRVDHGEADNVIHMFGDEWKRIIRDNSEIVLELPWEYEAPMGFSLRDYPWEGAPISARIGEGHDAYTIIVSRNVLPGEVAVEGDRGWWLYVEVATANGIAAGWVPSTFLSPIRRYEGPARLEASDTMLGGDPIDESNNVAEEYPTGGGD